VFFGAQILARIDAPAIRAPPGAYRLPIDMMEFFCLTPLPGSEDH
jgi:hypothetical protein